MREDYLGPRPDPWPDEIGIWLVWETTDTGVNLLGIATDPILAERWVRYVRMEREQTNGSPPVTFIEESKANHLYAGAIGRDTFERYRLISRGRVED